MQKRYFMACVPMLHGWQNVAWQCDGGWFSSKGYSCRVLYCSCIGCVVKNVGYVAYLIEEEGDDMIDSSWSYLKVEGYDKRDNSWLGKL